MSDRRPTNPRSRILVPGVVQGADHATFLDRAHAALFASIDMVGAVPIGACSARCPPSVDTADEFVEAYVPVTEAVPVLVVESDDGSVTGGAHRLSFGSRPHTNGTRRNRPTG